MFLHAGASLHGHEFSNRPPRPPNRLVNPQPAPRRNPLLRSALAAPLPSSSPPASTVSHASTAPAALASLASPASPASPPPSASSSPPPSSPAPILRANTISHGITPARPLHPSPHPRHVPHGALGPRPPEPVVRFLEPPVAVDRPAPLGRSLSLSAHSASVSASVTAPLPASTSRPPSLRPRHPRRPPAPEPMSDDEASFSASEASYASDQAASSVVSSKPSRRRSRRRAPRKSTTFLLAHPAPKLSTKKHLLKLIRPTLLMQLQQLSPDRRPRPVVDVYPSSLLAGNVAAPRFSKRFPRLFGINGELGLHDTIIVQSEDYGVQPHGSESDGDDDVLAHRALLAVLSPLRRGDRSEIALEDGSVWTTMALPTGSFDFVRVDEHGVRTTARWVRRSTTKPAPAPGGGDGAPAPDCKFTFSIIDPQSRRHPILATLTPSTLTVLDCYTTVSPSASRYPPTRSLASHDADASNDEELSHDEDEHAGAAAQPGPGPLAPAMLSHAKDRATLPVDAALKNFISISAIWVAMQCGWGQSPPAASCPGGSTAAGISRSVAGSVRFAHEQIAAAVDAATASDDASNRGRRLSARYKTRSATLTSIDLPDRARDASPSLSPRALVRTPLFPRKASSTGAAYIQRRKQMQLSDTSDSERPPAPAGAPAPAIAPRRRSRAFSRLSGEFTSMVSHKFAPSQSPSPSEAPAAHDVALEAISPVASLHQQQQQQQQQQAPSAAPSRASTAALSMAPATPEPLKRASWAGPSYSLRAGRSASAYYATTPLASTPHGPAAGRASPIQSQNQPLAVLAVPAVHASDLLDASSVDTSWRGTARPPRADSVLEKGSSGGGGAKWKRLGSWLKRLGGSGSTGAGVSTVGH